MAFVKQQSEVVTFEPITEMTQAMRLYKETTDFDHLSFIVESMMDLAGGADFVVEELKKSDTPKNLSAFMAAQLGKLPSKEAPIEKIMELLKLKNAYVRNLGISILQDYGEAIKYYIVKFLIGDDKDLRIFAVNVLGDVNFSESRDMLIELLETEEDVNVAMTAVDYMAEIGEPEDIPQLEVVKGRFQEEPYVGFAIDRAIACIKGE
jgi:HEAT repeat protein